MNSPRCSGIVVATLLALGVLVTARDARAGSLDLATAFFPTLRVGSGVSASNGASSGLGDFTFGIGHAVAASAHSSRDEDMQFLALRLEGGYHFVGQNPNAIETWSVGAALHYRAMYWDVGMVVRYDDGWASHRPADGYYVGLRGAALESIVGFEVGYQSLHAGPQAIEDYQAFVFLDAGVAFRLLTIVAAIPAS